jgi:8-oxo-dGTP diphosphatase
MPSTAVEVTGSAGVLIDDRGRVLLAQRPAHKHLGGMWEFPGGRIEEGEDARAGLARELHEELGIELDACEPLIHVRHAYPEKTVSLWFHRVTKWHGDPHGREGQPLRWVRPEEIVASELPPADVPVVRALQLPPLYAISAAARFGREVFLEKAAAVLAGGVSMIQLREPDLAPADYASLARELLRLCRRHDAKLLLNAEPAVVAQIGADGAHLPSRRLLTFTERPLPREKLVAASCHDQTELAHARAIGCDFCVLSPVLPTASHPGAPTLGWERFRQLAVAASMPVYALGGMQPEHVTTARAHWGQGIATLSGIWAMSPGTDTRTVRTNP